MNLRTVISAVALSVGFLASSANASLVQCGDVYRSASLDSADLCYAQTIGSTVKASDLTTITGSTWTQAGELTASGTDGLFTVTGTGWGTGSASGTWSISSAFWNTFGEALITMHVGGGQKNAVDNFEWTVSADNLSGTWSYSKLSGKGGGLSNIKLWGTGTPTVHAPEPSTLLLMLLGLGSITLVRRKNV